MRRKQEFARDIENNGAFRFSGEENEEQMRIAQVPREHNRAGSLVSEKTENSKPHFEKDNWKNALSLVTH